MRLKLIACEVLARQAYYVAALAPHVVDIELIDKGLHDEPDRLRSHLQERIDAVPAAGMMPSCWDMACAATPRRAW